MAQQAEQVETVFARHVQAVMARDLQAMMADYSDDVVMFTPQGPVQGKAALEANVRDFVLPLLTDEFVQKLKIIRQDIVGEMVYLLWEVPGIAPMGVDVFVIKDGKIVSQGFAMHSQS
jgi:ketosteroid isomerase-like protein